MKKDDKLIVMAKIIPHCTVELCNDDYGYYYETVTGNGKNINDLIDRVAKKLTKDNMPINIMKNASVYSLDTTVNIKIYGKEIKIFDVDVGGVELLSSKKFKQAVKKSKFYGVKSNFKKIKLKAFKEKYKSLAFQLANIKEDIKTLEK